MNPRGSLIKMSKVLSEPAPLGHAPVHEEFDIAVLLPNRPAPHSVQLPEPGKLYRPIGQMLPVALDTVDAAGHA
jgi:hypothetical protein